MKKRLVSMAFVLCMCITLLAGNVYAVVGNFWGYNATGNPVDDIVAVAEAQNGRKQSSMGYLGWLDTAWCAAFVSDCAEIVGQSDAIPWNANCNNLRNAVINAGGWYVSTPAKGDLIFWGGNHVAIMVDNANCIHGNISYNYGEPQVYKCHYTGDVGWGAATHYVRPNYRYSTRTLDVNGYLDGADSSGLGDYGTFDVYINGSIDSYGAGVNDYWNSTLPNGTSYNVTNIRPKEGKAYLGVRSGSRSGTLNGNVDLRLSFKTIDAAGYARSNQPAKIETYNGHTYHYYKAAVTWYEAKAIAEYLGGHLVTISSAGENSFIYNLGGNNTLWLGATDRDREGTWKWVNGENFSYSNWGSGEPNNSAGSLSGTQNYAVMWAREGEEGTWDDEDGSTPYPFVIEFDKPEKSVLSFSKNNVTTDAIKLLRWQGMDAASTGEPRNRGYDPTQTSDTVGIRLNGAPMAYSAANLAKAKELFKGVKYESLTHSGAVSQRVTEQADDSLTVGDKLKISFGSSGGNITATVTALKPVAMRLTMADGSECLIATPGDVNLDGEMNANDWTTIMRWTLQASSRYDVTEYPNFTLNGRSFDLWALLADMTGTTAGGSRSNRVDANDWTTIMYLTLQAWKK